MLEVISTTLVIRDTLIIFSYFRKTQMRQTQYGITSLKGIRVPLSRIHYEILTNEIILNLIITQVYKNTHSDHLECEYVFPIGIGMAVSQITIHNEDGSIPLEILEKKLAEEKYEDKISNIDKIYKIQYKNGMKDILSLKLGFLNPSEEIKVEIKLTGLLTIYENLREIRIPTSYAPRYPSKPNHKLLKSQDVTYFWTLNFEINTPSPILYINANQNLEPKINYSENNTRATGAIPSKQIPNADIVIYFKYENMHSHRLILQKSRRLNEYAAFLSIWPEELKGSKVEEIKVEEREMSQQEYIFLLDASFSMLGSKFHLSKYICEYILKKLPSDSSFNIIFFGAGINEMFPNPVPNTNIHITKAVDMLAKSDATLGNDITDQFISKFSDNTKLRINRTIYLLTGGGITSPKKVISEIKRNNYHSRVHAIGIGNGANQDLIIGAAFAGRGSHLLITDIDNIESKLSKINTNLSVFVNPIIKWSFGQ